MTASKINNKNTVKFKFLTWTTLTFLGFLCSLIWIEIGEPPDLNIIQAMIGATIISLFQSLILSRFLPHAWLWILATLIPWGLMGGSQFGVVGWFIPRTDLMMVRLQTGLILGGMTGIWLGLWQWFVLKPVVYNSYLWIIFNGISWSLGLAIGWVIGGILLLQTHLFLGEVIGLAIAWLLIGLQTGIVLSCLLRMNNLESRI